MKTDNSDIIKAGDFMKKLFFVFSFLFILSAGLFAKPEKLDAPEFKENADRLAKVFSAEALGTWHCESDDDVADLVSSDYKSWQYIDSFYNEDYSEGDTFIILMRKESNNVVGLVMLYSGYKVSYYLAPLE